MSDKQLFIWAINELGEDPEGTSEPMPWYQAYQQMVNLVTAYVRAADPTDELLPGMMDVMISLIHTKANEPWAAIDGWEAYWIAPVISTTHGVHVAFSDERDWGSKDWGSKSTRQKEK